MNKADFECDFYEKNMILNVMLMKKANFKCDLDEKS